MAARPLVRLCARLSQAEGRSQISQSLVRVGGVVVECAPRDEDLGFGAGTSVGSGGRRWLK